MRPSGTIEKPCISLFYVSKSPFVLLFIRDFINFLLAATGFEIGGRSRTWVLEKLFLNGRVYTDFYMKIEKTILAESGHSCAWGIIFKRLDGHNEIKSMLFSFLTQFFSNPLGHYRSVTANCDAGFSFLFLFSLIISLVRIKHSLLKKKRKKGKSAKDDTYLWSAYRSNT